MAEGQILQVSVFAVFFGIALAMLSEEKRAPMLRLCGEHERGDVQVHEHRDVLCADGGGRGAGVYGGATSGWVCW